MDDDSDLASKGIKTVEPFICTDLTVENITDITIYLREYELLTAVAPEGEYVTGEEFAEFYVDEESLWSCVESVFCT